jgi:hypothetical protein
MLLREGTRLGLPIFVAYDGSQVARKALAAATYLLQGRDGELTVLLLAGDPDEAERLQAQVSEWLEDRDINLTFRQVLEIDVDRLTELIQEEGCRVVVLPGPNHGLTDEELPVFLERVDCPVLVVR